MSAMFQADILPPMLPEPHPPLVQRGEFRHFDGTPAVFGSGVDSAMQRSKAEAPNVNCSIFTKMHQSCGEDDEDRPDTADTFNQIKIYFVINVSQLGWVCYFFKHPEIQFLERYCYQWYLATFKSGNMAHLVVSNRHYTFKSKSF